MFAHSLVIGSAGGGTALGNSLFTLVCFLILLVLLKKFAFGPLMGIMREREQYVQNQIKESEMSREETAALLEEQKNLLAQTRKDAMQNIEDSRKQGEKEREQILTFAKQEAERLVEAAKREIDQQKEQAIKSLREETSELAVAIASKVIERELNPNDKQYFMNDLLRKEGDRNE